MAHALDEAGNGLTSPVSVVHQEKEASARRFWRRENPCLSFHVGHSAGQGLRFLEDDGEIRGLLSEVLAAEGYLVDQFADGISWLNACRGVIDCSESRGAGRSSSPTSGCPGFAV